MSKLSVRKFGVGVASLALVAGVAPLASAALPVIDTTPAAGDYKRLAGKDRFATAVAVATDNTANNNAAVVYLVGANALVDAASAGALTDGPILVVPNGADAQEELGKTITSKYASARKLVAVGGKSVVSDEAITAIRKGATSIVAEARLDGANRYETSVAVAKAAYTKTTAARVYLTRGDMVVDALAAGAITDGPVLLVNPNGTVDKSVVDYYKSLDKTPANVVVIGGTGALSDAQVQQVTGVDTKIDPWKNIVSEATLKANVQKAAALYYGQDAWQRQAADLNTATPSFFGLAGSASAEAGTSGDPAKIDITKTIAGAANKFIGYGPIFTAYEIQYNKLNTQLQNAQTALRNAAALAVTNNVTRNEVKSITANNAALTAGDTDNAANAGIRLVQAFRNVHGQALAGTDNKDILDCFNFDTTGNAQGASSNDANKFTGLNTDAIDKLVAKARISDATIAAAKNETTDGDVADADHMTSPQFTTTGNPLAHKAFNLQVVVELLKPAYDKAKANADAAKKDLDAAVKAYTTRNDITVATGGAGVQRIAGADRYETAALLSIWATTKVGITKTEVYVASGNDANLVDAMVAGQLVKGPILLAPATGTLPKSTESELARLGAMATKPAVKVIGGTAAVSDDVAKAAAKVVKEAK